MSDLAQKKMKLSWHCTLTAADILLAPPLDNRVITRVTSVSHVNKIKMSALGEISIYGGVNVFTSEEISGCHVELASGEFSF